MQNYEVIPRKIEVKDGVAVNVTDMPQDKEMDGQMIGVGSPKIHNLYKGAWNPKREQMVWSFVMLVGAPIMKS